LSGSSASRRACGTSGLCRRQPRGQRTEGGDVSEDLERVYGHALERLGAIRDAWFAADQPLTGTGSAGQEVEHPLCHLLRDSEAHVAKLGEAVRRRAPGRPAVATLQAVRGRKAPSAELRHITSTKPKTAKGR
jgi:hypothetical protein